MVSKSGAIDLTAIYGFNGTDLYAVGTRIFGYNPNPPPTFLDSSLIIHFDGTSWKEEKMARGQIMRDIQGNSSNNFWACGRFNTLYHFNGTTWEKDSINIKVPQNQAFHNESVTCDNSNGVFNRLPFLPG